MWEKSFYEMTQEEVMDKLKEIFDTPATEAEMTEYERISNMPIEDYVAEVMSGGPWPEIIGDV
jgi:hypothetical protein